MRPDKRKAWVADDRGLRTLHNYYRSFLPSERAETRSASRFGGDATDPAERDARAARS